MSNIMSDEQLDREWKPNGVRPQSTIARSFSLDLNELFKIDSSIADLDAVVDKKKQAVTAQTSELEALEARLKAAEERLKAAATNPKTSPSGKSNGGASSSRQRVPLGDALAQGNQEERTAASPLAANFGNKTQSRPTSGWKQEPGHEMPGGLPPTPGASEGEYVIVDRERTSADVVVPQDGDSPIFTEAK